MQRLGRQWFVVAALLLAARVAAQQSSPAADQPGHLEARRFVELFLQRYHAQFNETAERPADWDPTTLVQRALTPELARALAADRAAQMANDEENVGLDFDPFSNSQDPCETYKAGRTAQRADTLMVEILGECHGQIPLIPDAVYMLLRRGREFAIADIVYPQGASLRGVLRELDEMRKRPTPPMKEHD
jgi:hypothetical protein